ncbi:MAG: acyl carrier protein [Candidatus Latescibacterota bacterium]|nr:acyl carrier protein [Candidatus Latescibacterota bacterium]
MQRREQILILIDAAIDELNLQRDPGAQLRKGADAPLFGRDGPLDSLGFVNLIADLEGRLEAEFGAWVNLADEALLEREESPFQSTGLLADYIDGVL